MMKTTETMVQSRIFKAIMLVSLIGLSDSIWLTALHLSGRSARCTILSGCSEVLSSSYAVIFGVPLAALGALAWFTAFSLSTLAAFGWLRVRLALEILAALMLMMSVRLFLIQAFVLHAFCEFCLLSAVMTLLLAVLLFVARWRLHYHKS
ncbi:MAG: vitamin K epoxide reductase family protein [Blastocatellia bacterium]